MISASDLEEKDSTEVLSVLGVNEKEISHQQKLRDLLKGAIIKTTKKAVFVLDKLTPVIPITLYLGPDEWDAPVSLHEMFDEMDERLRAFIPDYKIVLVSPNDLQESDLDKLDTDLREFLGAIKYSKNKERFESYILENFGFKDLDNETVEAINIFAGSNIKINKNGGSLELAIATFNNVSEEMIKDIYAEVTQ